MFDSKGKAELDEETALAILFTNLKGRKKKDYLATANACRFLRRLYGSYANVAEKVGVSSEIIREFDSLQDLPDEVREMVSKRFIRLDTGYRISTKLEGKKRKIDIAKAVASLGAFDARAIIEYAQKNPEIPPAEVKSRVLGSKTVTEKVHVFILPLSEELFQPLKAESAKLKIRPEELVKNIIQDWLKERGSES